MKNKNLEPEEDDMLPEYDFSGKNVKRGKYAEAMRHGYTVRIHNEDGTITETHYGPEIRLDPDVSAFFPDAESVNKALRGLIALIPNKQATEKKAESESQKS